MSLLPCEGGFLLCEISVFFTSLCFRKAVDPYSSLVSRACIPNQGTARPVG